MTTLLMLMLQVSLALAFEKQYLDLRQEKSILGPPLKLVAIPEVSQKDSKTAEDTPKKQNLDNTIHESKQEKNNITSSNTNLNVALSNEKPAKETGKPETLNKVEKQANNSLAANNVLSNNTVQLQESRALTRSMMVLLLISLLFIMFVAYKTYRRKSRYARIKKYGVRLTRGNIEMTPLPLDNDDEDETVFDLKNLPT